MTGEVVLDSSSAVDALKGHRHLRGPYPALFTIGHAG
jgi:hypothetical protein